MILCDSVDDFHEFFNFFITCCNLHTLTTKYIRRSY